MRLLLLATLVIPLWGASNSGLEVVVSSMAGDRLRPKPDLPFGAISPGVPVIRVDASTRYQKIDGFGATLTEAGMMVLNRMPEARRNEILEALFSPGRGAGYTLVKSPLAAFDFASAGPFYSYDDTPGDTELKHFSIARDLGPNGLVTFIKSAQKYGSFRIQSTMDYPPDWMLDAKMSLKPEYYPVFAQYALKYIQAYRDQGITIDYFSPFNEPQYIYCKIPYKEIAVLIRDHLGPVFEKAGVPTKLQTSDAHNRGVGLKEFPGMLSDPAVRKYVGTISVHGYGWENDTSDPIRKLHDMFPDIPVWQTEVCYAETIDKRSMPVYGFEDGDRWGRMIVADMKAWASGWIYWNAILDHNGGPWLVSVPHEDPEDNSQHPVVIANTQTGDVTYTGLHYYLAHFSRYVRPGASRIASTGEVPGLSFVAFQNANGDRILEVINSAPTPRRFAIQDGGRAAQVEQLPNSIATYLWR